MINTFFTLTIPTLGLLCIGWIGYCLLGLSKRNHTLLYSIPFYFLIGCGSVSTQLFVYSIFHIPWQPFYLIVPWLVCGLVVAMRTPNPLPKTTYQEVAVLALIISVSYALAWPFLREPILNVDGAANWGLKSLVFTHFGAVRPAPLVTATSYFQFVHPDYPLLLPLTQCWAMILSPGDKIFALRSLYPAMYATLLLLIYSTVTSVTQKKYLGIVAAFSFGLAPISIGVLSMIDADLLLAAYLLSAYHLLGLSYSDKTNPAELRLGILLLGFGAFTKDEGIIIYCLVFCLLLLSRSTRRLLIKPIMVTATLCSLLVWVPWKLYTATHHLRAEHWLGQFETSNFERVLPIIKAEIHSTTNYHLWGGILIAGILGIISSYFISNFHLRHQARMITLLLVAYTFLYVATPYDLLWHLNSSLNRLLFQIAPCAYVLFFQAADFLGKNRLLEKRTA